MNEQNRLTPERLKQLKVAEMHRRSYKKANGKIKKLKTICVLKLNKLDRAGQRSALTAEVFGFSVFFKLSGFGPGEEPAAGLRLSLGLIPA